MPEVCRFLGIVIKFFYNDHQPPHFHAQYSGYVALYEIRSLRVIEGHFPRHAHNLVLEWADQHRDELQDDWELARLGQELRDIQPLE